MNGGWRVAIAGMIVGAVAVVGVSIGPGAASADNSNVNTNTNDVTQQGGNPTQDTGSEKTNWPPTDMGWPPKEIMNGGVDNGANGNGAENSAEPPIVLPLGQSAPTAKATPTPTQTSKPIVGVNTP